MRKHLWALLAVALVFIAPAAANAACTASGNTSGTDSAAIVANTYQTCNSGVTSASTIADGADATQGAKADAKSTSTDTTPITVVSILKEISAMLQAPASTASGTNTIGGVFLQPTTAGGSSTYSGNITTAGTGAGTGGVAVDASPGQLYGYAIYNGNSSVCYIQIFDQTQPLTNLGTTVPKIAFGIPANGGANLTMPNGIPFATAITAGVTTTRSGSTACSSGLDINLWFK